MQNVGQKLSALECLAKEIGAGVRCPTCGCRDGDPQTGKWIIEIRPPKPADRPDVNWHTDDGRCVECDIVLARVRIVINGLRDAGDTPPAG